MDDPDHYSFVHLKEFFNDTTHRQYKNTYTDPHNQQYYSNDPYTNHYNNQFTNNRHSEPQGPKTPNFKIGDIVSLKSENKKMIIEGYGRQVDIDGHRTVICVWFNKNDELQRTEFYEYTLEKKINHV